MNSTVEGTLVQLLSKGHQVWADPIGQFLNFHQLSPSCSSSAHICAIPSSESMDDPAFRTVVQGTLITCKSVFHSYPEFWLLSPQTHFFSTAVITSLGVGAFETLKGKRPGMLVMASALNSGMVAVAFFCECCLRLDQTTSLTADFL